MEDNKLDFSGLEGVGLMISELTNEKTASTKVSENGAVDAYIRGIEAGLGADSLEGLAKIASEQLGRNVMRDFVPMIFLGK